MSNKVTGFFFVLIGCIVIGIYISDLYGWIDQIEWYVISSDYISRLYEYVKGYIPIFLLLLGLFVLIRMIIISFTMGKNKMTFKPKPQQQLHPADNAVGRATDDARISNEKDKNDIIRELHQQQIIKRRQQVMECVIDYVELTMAPYMNTDELHTLCDNIKNWDVSKEFDLSPTITNGQLSTLDLRHLAWNIGERFKWNGEERATFIKRIFPYEFRDLEIKSIRRNLRQQGSCTIPLDIPEKGNYKFHISSEQLL